MWGPNLEHRDGSRALRPGGVLLYAVCTFIRAEGAQQAERFLQSEAGRSFESLELPAPPEKAWASSDGSWCTYDDVGGSLADTFYAAAFRRKTRSENALLWARNGQARLDPE